MRELKLAIEGSGFNSVTDFVVYVLRDLVASGERQEAKSLTHSEIEAGREG